MLERIREGSQGPWAMIIIGLVVLSFVFAGVGSYLNSSGETVAATVNGEEIGLNELERAYQSQRSRMESQYGESVSALFADEGYMQQFRRGVLDSLIDEKLVEQKARELGLRVGDDQIRDTIRSMPEFQLGGQFNNDRYLALLRQNGYQPSDFRDFLRTQLTREQLTRALGVSDFALPGEARRVFDLQAQTRDARYVVVDAAPFADEVEISDADIQGYYDANITSFDTEEKVSVAYVKLSVDDLKGDVTVSDDDVSAWFEENKDQYRDEEQRRVSHILIETGDDEEAAKAKAEALLAEIKGGADFATVAEESSEDSFSAENGGDLDYITPGMMDDAFDSAVFSLKNVGDVTDVVKTEFGFHIIKLTDLKPETIKPFSDVAGEIRDNLITEKATDRFYELQSSMAEVAFEVPDTLDEVAAIANTSVETTPLFTRNDVPAEIDNPQVVSDVFSPELIEEQVNSDLIELDASTVMVVRVNEHEAQRTKSLDEVKESITASLRSEKAQQAAQDWAEAQLAQLESGNAIADSLSARSLDWETVENVNRGDQQLPRNLLDTLFTLAPAEGKSRRVALLGSGDVALIELTAVHAPEAADDATVSAIRQRLAQANSQSTYAAFVKALRDEADVALGTAR
ncbi:peptidylprolyl isomerase [Alteromonas sp. 1_MG-2023]|uniref:peptidylprolyl isomerase n=1 Tax=Alteromonas sp. 1_MG-2023 TaxID=3062669 RepID=UPI0026E1D953|nr:peptidylprolyl isomerase [Alteromonas sp. 1_MG-2023]MDO6474987.1 peptidylprolyl isomerase [Alteromonas sp. 1_MG-2023]